MAQRTKGKQSKYWSYNTGERGRNWVRAYEDGRDGKLYLEWRDCGQRRRALLRNVQDTEVAKQRADRLAAELGEFQLPESPAPITLDELLRLYGKEVTPGKGGSKQAHDGRATRVWMAFFDGQPEMERRSCRHPSTLDRTDWDRFIEARRTGTIFGWPNEVGERQVQYDLKFMIAVLNWAMGHKVEGKPILEVSPWQGDLRRSQKWGMPKEQNPLRPGMDEDLRAGLIANSTSWQFELALTLERETKRRNNTIRRLQWSDIDLEAGVIHWRAELDKTGRENTTPLSREALEALRLAPSRGIGATPVFPSSRRHGEPTSRHTFQTWLRRAKQRFLQTLPEPQRNQVRNRLLGVGFHAEKREGVRDPAFRSLPSKIQEELAGTRFETLSNIYDKVGVEEMRAAMEQVNQAVSGLN